MEHRHDQRVSEYRMDQRYLQKEGAFREEAAKLWTDEASARERIRSNVTLAPEDRPCDAPAQGEAGGPPAHGRRRTEGSRRGGRTPASAPGVLREAAAEAPGRL
jgi:hypothetical protein